MDLFAGWSSSWSTLASSHFSSSLPALSSGFLCTAASSCSFWPNFKACKLFEFDFEVVSLSHWEDQIHSPEMSSLTFLWWSTFLPQFCLLKFQLVHFFGKCWQKKLTCISLICKPSQPGSQDMDFSSSKTRLLVGFEHNTSKEQSFREAGNQTNVCCKWAYVRFYSYFGLQQGCNFRIRCKHAIFFSAALTLLSMTVLNPWGGTLQQEFCRNFSVSLHVLPASSRRRLICNISLWLKVSPLIFFLASWPFARKVLFKSANRPSSVQTKERCFSHPFQNFLFK